jgi:predicted anti-sigma-YlaC factor YlaD
MTDKTACDDVMLSMMALADGETPPLAVEAVGAHLEGCSACRALSDELADTSRLLGACRRQTDSYDLWPALAPHLAPPAARRVSAMAVAPFAALVVILVAFRLLLYGASGTALGLKLTAVALVVAAFLVARENPFKIEAERPLGAE